MTWPWILIAAITAALVAAIAVGLWLDRSTWPGGPDAVWLAELGAEHADEEKIVRRLSLADRLRQRAARIGRRPRP
jgi:hypothetical protein